MFKREYLTDPRTLALTGIMTAVIFALTSIVKIPTPGIGYIHLGDAGVLFTSFAFGPVVGTIASALGTALADLTSPYAEWAPFTLVIHGLMGFLVSIIVYRNDKLWRMITASIVAGVVLVVGYLLVGLSLFGAIAIQDIPLNIAQIVAGAIVAIPLYYAVRRAYPPLIWHNFASEND